MNRYDCKYKKGLISLTFYMYVSTELLINKNEKYFVDGTIVFVLKNNGIKCTFRINMMDSK